MYYIIINVEEVAPAGENKCELNGKYLMNWKLQ